MKRSDLERRLRIAGCYLKRQGRNHSIWINPKNGTTETITRHNEIKEPLKLMQNFHVQTEKNLASVLMTDFFEQQF